MRLWLYNVLARWGNQTTRAADLLPMTLESFWRRIERIERDEAQNRGWRGPGPTVRTLALRG